MQTQQPTPAEAKITQELAQDRPTIDSAVKSFLSLICARCLTESEPWPLLENTSQELEGNLRPVVDTPTASKVDNSPSIRQQQALQFSRSLLQTMNAFQFPIHSTVATSMGQKPGTTKEKQHEFLELSIVAKLWNGLVESNQKPSRFLGRRALRYAWKQNLDIPISKEDDKQKSQETMWLQEFERLLFLDQIDDESLDNDAALLWDADGGQAELAKRRQRRQSRATERIEYVPS